MSASEEDFKTPHVGINHVEETTEEEKAALVAEEKALVRKIDLFLMPTIWLMYLLSYMDRTNIGNAKIAGMADDLALDSTQYSISLVVFFITYVLCEVPSNLVLSRTRPSVFLPIIMFTWGAVTCCMALINTFGQLVALRMLVGVFEAGFAPGILLIISSWYKRNEQSKRFAVYISAAVLSGAFGGLLAGAITSGLDGIGGLRGWKWLFIVEGAATCVWSIIAHFILLDFPATTKRFTPRERELARTRLENDNVASRAEGEAMLGPWQSFKSALTNWRTWLLTVGYMVIVGSSTLSYFYPTLVKGLGYSSTMAQYMTTPIYAVAFVAVVVNGILCDKIPNWRGVVIAGWLTLACLCSVVVCAVYDFTARYVLLIFMAAGLWAGNALSLSYASSTFATMKPEVRAVSLAFVNAMGNLASIYGSFLFPAEHAPKYLQGFGVVTAMCGIGIAVYITAHIMVRKHFKPLA